MREKLLKTGMGCFVFASGVGVANTLLLPYARAHFGYPVWGTWAAYAAALLLFCLAGRAVSVLEDEKAARFARVIAPTFIACLFAAHLLMGYLLEYTPAGDNFMLYNGSQMLAADGNFDRYTDFYLYLSRYSNQWGFMLMLTGFYKLLFALGVTQTFFPLALTQAVLYIFGVRAILRIAERLSGAKGRLMTMLMLACCLPLWLAAAVLYTDTFSLPFIAMALDLALRVKDAANPRARFALSARCSLVVLIGCQIKMTALIALIAAAIVWLLTMKPRRHGGRTALYEIRGA